MCADVILGKHPPTVPVFEEWYALGVGRSSYICVLSLAISSLDQQAATLLEDACSAASQDDRLFKMAQSLVENRKAVCGSHPGRPLLLFH